MAPFEFLFPAGSDWARRLFVGTAVACVEAEYIAGEGTESALVWRDGEVAQGLTSGVGAVRAALRTLAVSSAGGRDEFEVVGLGRFRRPSSGSSTSDEMMADEGATRTIEGLLARATLFRRLSADDRGRLAAVTVAKAYKRGDVVFQEGEESSHLFTVLSGRVKAVKLTPSGQEAILEIFGPGDPLGAVAVYEGRPYPASAVALEDASCLRIERAAFFALLEERPTLVRGVLSGLNLRLVELTRRIAELMGGRVENRLARLLTRLGREFGRPTSEGISVPMSLTRQELADMTGTTVETCIRIMSRWSKDGLVRTEAEGFLIVDPDALDLLAQS